MTPTTNQTINCEKVLLSDATLLATPGMEISEKLSLAKRLAEFGVDIIEAGTPAMSKDEWETVRSISSEVLGAVICSRARCNSHDIELAATAVGLAEKPRIQVVLAAGNGAEPSVFGSAKGNPVRCTENGVRIARNLCSDVEFCPLDVLRMPSGLLEEVIEAAVVSGATTLNIYDSVGHCVPDELSELIRFFSRSVGIDRHICLSVRCNNNLGLALANSLAAVLAGARQVGCSIEGGAYETSGCGLESIMKAITAREAFYNVTTGINVSRLLSTPMSKELSLGEMC